MDENISRAAGASHGQELDEAEFRAIVEPLGRTLEQRTTLYGRTTTVGRPAAAAARAVAADRRRRPRPTTRPSSLVASSDRGQSRHEP